MARNYVGLYVVHTVLKKTAHRQAGAINKNEGMSRLSAEKKQKGGLCAEAHDKTNRGRVNCLKKYGLSKTVFVGSGMIRLLGLVG